MPCSTLWLSCRSTTIKYNRFYIISVPCNWWIWLGLMIPMIYGRIPQFIVVNAIALWQEPTIHLEGHSILLTRTTPALMQYTKVSYYAWFWLWHLVIIASCTKRMCVWKSGWPIHTTNMACLTLWLQCRCTAITPKTNSTLLVGILLTDELCLGYHFQWYTMGYAPQFTLEVHRNVLWYTTIHQEGWASCIESTSA
jgi:hypothetical protein